MKTPVLIVEKTSEISIHFEKYFFRNNNIQNKYDIIKKIFTNYKTNKSFMIHYIMELMKYYKPAQNQQIVDYIKYLKPNQQHFMNLITMFEFAQNQENIDYFKSIKPPNPYVINILIIYCKIAQTENMVNYYLSTKPNTSCVILMLMSEYCKFPEMKKVLNYFLAKIKSYEDKEYGFFMVLKHCELAQNIETINLFLKLSPNYSYYMYLNLLIKECDKNKKLFNFKNLFTSKMEGYKNFINQTNELQNNSKI